MTEAAREALKVEGVRKRFGDVRALNGVDLTVERGEVFGFLGPNGAGKTTTIRILTGFVRADEGSASVLGLDAWRDTVAIKANVGFLPDTIAFGSGFTGQAFLDYMARLRGISGRPVTSGGAAGTAEPSPIRAPTQGEGLLVRHGEEAGARSGDAARP